ncbi:hypothetical protein Taro_054589 [Colocasia esculenta]|uniref:Uncharacterized protein n=1 Tax=Colocasia esculenta TaxID=4460 RepID=A0A843XNY7_COLES|nr:hypothetical protein [Colocasia esculenta]
MKRSLIARYARVPNGDAREGALVVGGTDTSSRHWSPASPFPVPHSSELGPGSLEVLGMGLSPCGPQTVSTFTAFISCLAVL